MLSPPKDLPHLSHPNQNSAMQSNIRAGTETSNVTILTQTPQASDKKPLHLPKLELPATQEIIITSPKKNEIPYLNYSEDNESFDEAIKKIHIDLLQSNDEANTAKKQDTSRDNQDYYKPKSLGEGYFSEIKHFLQNKDLHDITDEMLSKDMLTSMKDYHDHKSKGKPYYLHSKDLQEKLERKLLDLMKKEEEWHEAKKAIEDIFNTQKKLEKGIDEEAQQLKMIFTLIKISKALNKNAPEGQEFKLVNSQKLKNLNDLRKSLTYLSDEEFYHHANLNRNDFADWTLNALSNPSLAEKIRLARNKQELEEVLKNPL